MRRVVVTENITVDGVIDMSGGWGDPSTTADQSDLIDANRELRRSADALLVGRGTFEAFRGYWPAQTDDPTGIADYLNAVDKYVISSTLADPEWENTTVLSGDPVAEAAALKDAPGGDIVATGSPPLVHALLAGGVVDEVRMFQYPVVVGEGVRLFGTEMPALSLLEARSFASGVVLLRYATG